MRKEKVFLNFHKVRDGYYKLIEIFTNQEYRTVDHMKIAPVAKRIKINNLITTILGSVERFSISEMSKEDLTELTECFSIENVDLNMVRNCLAHAHYEVDDRSNSIELKKGDFFYNISLEKLSEIACKTMNFAEARLQSSKLPFNGVKLNGFIDRILDNEETIQGDIDMLATLIQSYNIYHAFLYEKVVQDNEQRRFGNHYKNSASISEKLPYVNQKINQSSLEISFESINFKELSQTSQADLMYFMMTSEYKKEALDYFKSKVDGNIDDREMLKKIFVMYLYPSADYKEVVENLFENGESIDQYMRENISEKDYDNYNDLIEFMIRKMPKTGRIENGQIMPRSRDLTYGFEKIQDNLQVNDFMFVYPPMSELIKNGTDKELFEQYVMTSKEIQEEFKALEITENKIITLPEFMFFVSKNMELVEKYMEVPESIKIVAGKLIDAQNENPKMMPGQIYGNMMKDKENKSLKTDIASFYREVPDDLKDKYVMTKIKSYLQDDKFELAYRNVLFLLSTFRVDERMLELKDEMDFRYKLNRGKINIVDEERFNKMHELGMIFNYKPNTTKHVVDYTDFLTHIRDSSIHAFTEVDYSKITQREFIVRRREIDEKEKDDKIDLSNLRFNFQDYNPTTSETSFLLTNIPMEQVINLIDLPSDRLIARGRVERSDDDGSSGR